MTLIHIQTIVTNNIKLISMTPETKIRTADFVIPSRIFMAKAREWELTSKTNAKHLSADWHLHIHNIIHDRVM